MKARLPFIFIIITLMLDSIGIGLIIPVMPDLVMDLTGGSVSEAALWGGFLATTYAVMQFIFGPTIGSLSDRFGRRPVLLISMLALGLDYIFLSFASTIWLLFIGRVIAGIAGATFSTAAAYVADISAPEKRAANFGLVGASFGLGFVFGPAIGGLLGELGPRAPFMVAAAVALANVALGYFILPETLSAAKRRKFEWKRANPVGALISVSKMQHMLTLVVIFFIFTISHQVYQAVWSYFTIEMFDFTPKMIGLSLATFGFFMAIMQGGVIRILLPKLGEMRTAVYGLSLNILIFIAVAFVGETWQLFALMPLMTLGVIASPAIQGIMSNIISDDAQGELQGIFASITGLAMIFSPLTMTGIFRAFTVDNAPIYLPGAPFLFAALLEVITLGLLLWLARKGLSEWVKAGA